MSKKKSITYQTSEPKSNKMVIKIDSSKIRGRDYVFLSMIQNCRSQVVEDKRKKDPKYKNKFLDYSD